jgi:hypothetical protein
MKAEQKESLQAKPVIIWESNPRKGTGSGTGSGQIIPFPEGSLGTDRKQSVVEQEPTVTIRQVGSEATPAIVTEVSSGFARKRATGKASQTIRMSLAA